MMGYLVCVFCVCVLFLSRVGYLANEGYSTKNKRTKLRYITRMPQTEEEEAGNPTRKGRQEVVEVDPMLTLLLRFLVLLVLLVQKLLPPLNLEALWRRRHNHNMPGPGQWRLVPPLKILLRPAVLAPPQVVRTPAGSTVRIAGSTAVAAGSSTGCKPRIGRRCKPGPRQGLQLQMPRQQLPMLRQRLPRMLQK